eukprot:2095932-Amphidinium_carterae.1
MHWSIHWLVVHLLVQESLEQQDHLNPTPTAGEFAGCCAKEGTVLSLLPANQLIMTQTQQHAVWSTPVQALRQKYESR